MIYIMYIRQSIEKRWRKKEKKKKNNEPLLCHHSKVDIRSIVKKERKYCRGLQKVYKKKEKKK